MHRIRKVIEVLNCREFLLFAKVCVSICWTSDFYYISMYSAFRRHTTSLFLSLSRSLSFFLSSACCLSIDITHPKRNNTVSSRRWQWCMSLMGKHFSGVVIIKPFLSLHRPHVKEIQRQGPKCNTLISLKLFIGICGALAAGLSPFQLPDLFNSVGNEKCAVLLELQSKKPSRLSHCFSLSFILSLQSSLSHVRHVSVRASVFAKGYRHSVLKIHPNFWP